MFGLKIFVRVQTFRRMPPVLPRNFCHPGAHDGVGDDDGNEVVDNGDDGAVKATGISPPRFAKKLRLDQASLPPTQLPQEIQVLLQCTIG